MEILEQQNLPFLLSALQAMSETDTAAPNDSILERIEKNRENWASFIERQKEHCQKSMRLFRFYDTKNKLKSFWIRLELHQPYPRQKTLTLLDECAAQAEERGNFEDAFHMFSFMALLYPRNHVLYLKVCRLVEQLYGLEAATQLYELTARLFEEPSVLFLAAECEARDGHWDRAKTYVTQALKIFEQRPPNTPEEIKFKADLKELSALVEKACA